MLKAEYLQSVPDNMIKLFAQAEADILADMARRISEYDYWIPAAEHQAKMLEEAGMVREEILARLNRLTGKTTKELTELMVEAGTVWVPTLSAIGNLRGRGRFEEDAVERILGSAMENVQLFAALGGLLAPGTDAGAWSVPHGSLTEYTLLETALGRGTREILNRGIQRIQRIF